MTKRARFFRSPWVGLILVICILLLCGLVVFGAVRDRSALPERPVFYSVQLEWELNSVERSLWFPWSDRASCWLVIGQLYHANRFHAEAKLCYGESLKLSDEEAARIHYYFSDMAKQNGNLSEAKASLAKVVSLEPDYLPALLDYSEICSKSGDGEMASLLYGRVLLKDKDNPKALLELARVAYRQDRTEEALQLLLRLAGRDPNYVEGISLLTQVLDTLGQEEKAAALRAEMSRLKPVPSPNPWMEELLDYCFDVQRLSFLFEDYLKAGELEKALSYLDRMEMIEPDSPQAESLRGYAFYQVRRYEKAVPHYRRAIALGGDKSSLYYYLVTCLAESGQLEKAEQAASEGLGFAPGNADLVVARAEVVLKLGRRSEAIALFKQALALVPAHLVANRALAKLYWDGGKKASALEQLEMLRRLQPTDFATRMTLAGYYLEQSDFAAVISVAEEAHRIDPANADGRGLLALAWMRSGNAAARQNDYETTLVAYRKAIAVDPNLEEAYLNSVKVLAHLQRYAEAEETIRSLIKRKPEDAVLYISLGDIQDASGEKAAAEVTWSKALDRANVSEQLRLAIEERLSRETR